jgi:glycosyltransferase involved in cell wall biosynthesis
LDSGLEFAGNPDFASIIGCRPTPTRSSADNGIGIDMVMTQTHTPTRPAPAPSSARRAEDQPRRLVAVVIPCYRVRDHILDVLAAIGPQVDLIFVIDDCCPEHSGDLVESSVDDPRVRVVRSPRNTGVGGAVIAGYKAALAANAGVIVKIDGDGQMDPALIPQFIEPILRGEADYAKGNRFFEIAGAKSMPPIRKLGNLGLSFFTKLASGYWNIFDPTNGYTAIHGVTAACLPLDRVSQRYFFESDMLAHLNLVRAVVCDVPMAARYGAEQSGLSILRVLPRFVAGNLTNFARRVLYNYFLRDFNIASIELVLGLGLLAFGTIFGVTQWARSEHTGVTASAGTVMLAALPILLGVQLLLSFLNFDTSRGPTTPMHRRISMSMLAAAREAMNSGRAGA